MSRPAAFLFDMDGLLLDTERLFLQSFLEKTSELGLDPAEAELFFLSLVGTSARVTSERLHRFLPKGLDIGAFEADWRERHSKNVACGVPLKSSVMDALSLAKSHGIPMAVVTSTAGHHARHHLKFAGILDFFQQVKGGDEVSANKPDPAPYVESAEALGFAPQDCVAFEDSDLGITAAVTAGCVSYQIPDLRMPKTPLPDLGQHSKSELIDAVSDALSLNPEVA